jgi:hypothetical protein
LSEARRALRRLSRVFQEYDAASSEKKRALLSSLERRSVSAAAEVLRLHEILCFLRAFPDDAALLAQVERMLRRFEGRADLRRHRADLEGSGIAGTAVRFRFFAPAAARLARRFGEHLRIDWDNFENAARLQRLLPALTLYAETPAIHELGLTGEKGLAALRGPKETDAAFLLRRWETLRLGSLARDVFYDDLDPALLLLPGPGTPSRTREKYPHLPVVWQTRPLDRARPDLHEEIARPPLSVEEVSAREGRALIELARDTMVPRERDLEAFSYGAADDVRMVDCGEGLVFACIGCLPERRSPLEAVYSFLTLKNGVPIGYALCSALFGSSEVAYNVFESYRGGESARVFGRLLASIHHLFGSDVFTIVPYQLGHDNLEGLRSGAFWFYQKLGFRPRKPEVVRTMDAELARMRARPGHRSSLATLETLASANVFFYAGRRRRDVIGILSLPKVALHVSRLLAARSGADRERAERVCVEEAAARFGLSAAELRSFGPGERQAFERWAPMLLLVAGALPAGRRERRSVIEVVRAKGGRRESDYVARFDAHRPLREAVRKLSQSGIISAL